MGPCALRDKPKGNTIEINDDIVTQRAEELAKKHAYEVPHFDSQEEVLVSMAANMQAMSQKIRSKNAFHLNKLQRMKKLRTCPSMSPGASRQSEPPISPEAQEDADTPET